VRGLIEVNSPGSNIVHLSFVERPLAGVPCNRPTIINVEIAPEQTFRFARCISRSREAVSSVKDGEIVLRLGRSHFPSLGKTARNRRLLSIPTIKQRGSIMWHTIIGLFYRQACKASLYAIRRIQ